MAVWIIKNDDGDYWNNEHGWIEFLSDATRFTEREAMTFRLPIGGKFISLKYELSGKD